MSRPATLGELRESGYRARSVKDELRENLIRRLEAREPLFPELVGYEETVIPQLINAILSRHDMLILGLRGQAKTRLARMLPLLLDEYSPTPAESDVLDDPLAPRWARTRRLIEVHGEATPIRWVHRDERFHEKLATPDVTIADLIGEIDLVRHAEGRYLSDEAVIHFGLVPRTNRGIFALNELPDLAPRIQVGLFNVLQERDVQIRGFPVRLPLDICAVFTANPEDYTNRGRIVTPLKDRIGSVIRTHYPRSAAQAMAITQQNAWLERNGAERRIVVPRFMLEVIEEMAHQARQNPHINQQSGVSARVSIANAENMVSSAERRAILCGEKWVVPRACDLEHLTASCRGKIELLLADDEHAEDKLIAALFGEAVKKVFAAHLELDDLDPVVEHFRGGKVNVQVGDDVRTEELVAAAEKIPALKKNAVKLCMAVEADFQQPALLASAIEFLLEALYVNNRLSKYAYRGRTIFQK